MNMQLFNEVEAPRCSLHGRRTLHATWMTFTWHRHWVCVNDENTIISSCAPTEVDAVAFRPYIEIDTDLAMVVDDSNDEHEVAANDELEDVNIDEPDELEVAEHVEPEVADHIERDFTDEYIMLVDIFENDPVDFTDEYHMALAIFSD